MFFRPYWQNFAILPLLEISWLRAYNKGENKGNEKADKVKMTRKLCVQNSL